MIHYVLVKISWIHYKMAPANKIKTVNDKIKPNQAQYDLDREATKVSVLPSKNFKNMNI